MTMVEGIVDEIHGEPRRDLIVGHLMVLMNTNDLAPAVLVGMEADRNTHVTVSRRYFAIGHAKVWQSSLLAK